MRLSILALLLAASAASSAVPCAICGTADPFRQYSPSDVGVVCNFCRDAELLKQAAAVSQASADLRSRVVPAVDPNRERRENIDEALSKAIDKRERRRLRNIRNERRKSKVTGATTKYIWGMD